MHIKAGDMYGIRIVSQLYMFTYLQNWLTHEAYNSWLYFADNFFPKGTFSKEFLRCTIMLTSIKMLLHVK